MKGLDLAETYYGTHGAPMIAADLAAVRTGSPPDLWDRFRNVFVSMATSPEAMTRDRHSVPGCRQRIMTGLGRLAESLWKSVANIYGDRTSQGESRGRRAERVSAWSALFKRLIPVWIKCRHAWGNGLTSRSFLGEVYQRQNIYRPAGWIFPL